MGNNSHILDFTSKKSPSESKRGSRPLPVLVEDARAVCINELDKNIRNMLEQVDDALFDMSDSGYNNAHFDAMRMLRLKKENLVRAFSKEIKENFSENLGKTDENEVEDDNQSMSFENIALVEESDLEEGIAVDGIVKKARNENLDALEKIRSRLDTLISNQAISKENNPFEPAFICSAFKKASLELEIDIESMLVIYKLFERSVVSELDSTYAKVNQFFIDKGVLPDLKVSNSQVRRRAATQTAYQAPNDTPLIDDLLEIGSAEQSSVEGHQVSANGGGEQLIAMMQGLLAQNRPTNLSGEDISGGNNSLPIARQIDTSQLITALTQIQGSVAQPTSEVTNVVSNLRNELGNQLSPNHQPIQHGALGQFNDDMIDIVSMLFDFILDDKNVHAEVKSIIARLQIPMLKVGLVDRSFFSNKKHPARILLNEIARAGISWDPEDAEAQKMLHKIESICDEINTTFKDDISIFNILLDDFEAFRKQVQRRADIFERRTREAEEGKAKAENARSIVNQELEKICRGRHVPESTQDILKNVWVNVMFLERLKDSQEGWDKVRQIAKLLIWSVQPISNAQALEKLIGRIPSLVKNLRKGFEIISLSPIDGTRLLEEMEATHRQIIKEAQERIEADSQEEILRLEPAPLVPEVGAAEISQEANVSDVAEEEIPIETIEIHDIGFTPEQTGQKETNELNVQVEVKQESVKAVERLNAGHWVELEQDGQSVRCKLAAKISSSGKYIFVNRSGVKMAEFLTNDLAIEYQLGRLKILDEEALFDRALESVISNLRAMKSES